jgi:hypothetical protein
MIVHLKGRGERNFKQTKNAQPVGYAFK